jgi:hypothetical protein
VTREDFDVILGSCVGVSDLPAAAFARELIAAYPEAKVILNSRGDMEGWRRSFEVTLGRFDGDKLDWEWCKSWFWYVGSLSLFPSLFLFYPTDPASRLFPFKAGEVLNCN